jgi:hypothetical protein
MVQQVDQRRIGEEIRLMQVVGRNQWPLTEVLLVCARQQNRQRPWWALAITNRCVRGFDGCFLLDFTAINVDASSAAVGTLTNIGALQAAGRRPEGLIHYGPQQISAPLCALEHSHAPAQGPDWDRPIATSLDITRSSVRLSRAKAFRGLSWPPPKTT